MKNNLNSVLSILKEQLGSDLEKMDLDEIVGKVIKDLKIALEEKPNITMYGLKKVAEASVIKYASISTPINDEVRDTMDSIIDLSIEETVKTVQQTYDLSDEQKRKLIDAYREFNEQFWVVKLLKHQGDIIKNLITVLKDIHEIEASELEQAKALSENETKELKADFERSKTDAKILYNTLLATSRDLLALKTSASKGLVSADRLKSKFKGKMSKVQDDIFSLYKDLYSLYSRQDTDNIPKEEEDQEKLNEQTTQEPSRKEKTDVMKTVHSKIKKLLIPIVSQLTSDDSLPIPFKKMSVAVTSAIKELNKVLSFFPSIRYSDNLFSSYRDSIRELDFIFTNIQDPSITSKSIAVRTMLDKLQDFSSNIEELFDVPSKISNISSDKPKPKPDEQEPDEQ